MTVDEARALMHEWVTSEALRAHMEAVAACVGAYARKLAPGEEERWVVCGLLHDFDYERNPSPEQHPFVGVKELERLGVDEEIRTAILGHADYSGTPRESPLSKVLYACDELAGFIVACCKVRPNGIGDLTPKSVRKKLKDRAFAANVSREDIARGVRELSPICGVSDPDAFESQHIQTCIEALRSRGEALGI
ncbi:MAG: HDIG domain-containing protein [Actinomycetota bacterium]|nr:HDIG domain-containing protein [Actinomycetota bacterium]